MLEVIIPHINQKIQALNMFKTFFGLCEIIKDGEKSFPAEYCKGEYKQVSDFDLSKGTVYHRLTGQISSQEIDDEQVVSCDPFYEYTFPIRTIAVIKKDLLKGIGKDAYLENKIAQNIATSIAESNNKSLRISLQADTVTTEINNIITNRDDLFSQEYKGYDKNFIRFEYIYVGVDYNVKVSLANACFNLYQCQ